jgi:hypothetical protein
VRSVNSVQNRGERSRNPGNKPGKKEEEEKPDTFRKRQHIEKSETNDKD